MSTMTGCRLLILGLALAGCASPTPGSGALSPAPPPPVLEQTTIQQQMVNQQAITQANARRHIATNCSFVGKTLVCR